MAKKKTAAPDPPPGPVGPIILKNLIHLGYGMTTLKHSEVARLVTEKTGQPMSRQRVAAIMNSVNVSDKVVAALARAVGVKPVDLTTPKQRGEK